MKYAEGQIVAGITIGTARANWRKIVAEACADWRLGCIPPRSNGHEAAIFHEGIADIARLRLWIAYMPLLQAVERIQHRAGVLANLRREPWAPADHPVNW